MEDVAIIGVGQSVFTRSCGVSIRELCFEAYKEAMEGLDITSDDIDASIVCSAPEYDKQRTPSGLISEYLELTPKPTFYVESVCSSSSTGLRVAWSLIKSGLHKVVAVIGFQKMSELSSREAAERMGRGGDIVWESPFGLTMPAGYAMYARGHMAKYGTTEEHLAKIRVKSTSYGAKNPKAHMRRETTIEKVLAAPTVAWPLGLFDCCGVSDGAAVAILTRPEIARELRKDPVQVKALQIAVTSGEELMYTDWDGANIETTHRAGIRAYKEAGITNPREEIGILNLHDCFSITELVTYEDLQISPRGGAPKDILDGFFDLDGSIPCQTDGGLKCFGHPIGASGLRMIYEIYKQLQGKAGDRQVAHPKFGLTHNLGGFPSMSVCSVAIFGS